MSIFSVPMNLSKKIEQRKQKTLANPPTSVQLPGGVTLKAMNFRITAVDSGGRPTAFELVRGNEDSDCMLWVYPPFVDDKLPAHLDERYRARIEASIEGPDLVTEEREYKGRSVGISMGYHVKDGDKLQAWVDGLCVTLNDGCMVQVFSDPNKPGGHYTDAYLLLLKKLSTTAEHMKAACTAGLTPDEFRARLKEVEGFCPLSEPFGDGTRKCACHGVGTRAR